MPFTYDFECATCASRCEQKVPYGVEACPCPACGGRMTRQFTLPTQVMFMHADGGDFKTTPQDTLPLSTAQHTSNYLAHRRMAEFSDSIQAQYETRNHNRKSFEQQFKEKNPDLDLNKQLTKADSDSLKQVFGNS